MPGVLVDGNDVAPFSAVGAAVTEIRRRRSDPHRSVDYRLGPHTTADDPGRYRDEDEAVEWRAPILGQIAAPSRERRWLDPEWQAGIRARATEVIEEAVAIAEALPQPTAEEMLLRMYEQPTGLIEEQLGEIGR